MTQISHRVFTLALVLAATSMAPAGAAQAVDTAPAADLFARALEAAGTRSPEAGAVCGYRAELSWRDEGPVQYEVDPLAGARWREADGDELADPDGLPENGVNLVTLFPARIFESREPPRFVRWDEGLAVYELLPVSVTLSGGGFNFDIAENVIVEVAVDPQSARFVSRTVRAPESFRPNMAVRIRAYETVTDFAPAWPDGPLVIASRRHAILASAMMQTFDVNGEDVYGDFRPCQAG